MKIFFTVIFCVVNTQLNNFCFSNTRINVPYYLNQYYTMLKYECTSKNLSALHIYHKMILNKKKKLTLIYSCPSGGILMVKQVRLQSS